MSTGTSTTPTGGTTPSTTPTGGTTPTSVPSFTPRSTQRSNTAAAAIRPRVKQEDRSSLSTKAYDTLQASAVESLSSKFDLMSSAENNDEKLTGTYTLNMVLQQFIRKLKIYDLQRAFILIQPDPTATDGSVLPDIIPLLDDYDKQSLQQYVVERSVEHMRKWGEDFDIENLEWSQELLENSCSEELRNLVSEQMLEINTIYHGGPLFFYLMMKIIIRTTNEATRKLIERIRNLNISNIRGENILQVTSLIRGAVTRLGDKVPSDITDIVLKVYQTTSYEKFNRLFEQMEVNIKINTGAKYTLQEITSVANSNYQEMLDTDVWQNPGSDNAFLTNKKTNKNNKGGKGKNKRGGNNNDGNKKQHKKYIPPQQGESHTRKWNDITLHWCPKCKAWRKHTPSQHVDQDEYERRRRDESEQTSKATKTTSDTQPTSITTDTDASSADKSSVTFASSFRRWKE